MEINKIYKGDSIEVLKMLPSESIDFIFADPPYYMQTEGELLRTDGTKFNGVEDEWDKFESFQDYDNFTKQWLGECRRVLKKNGTIAMNIQFGNFIELLMEYLIKNDGKYLVIEKKNSFKLSKKNDELIDNYITNCQTKDEETFDIKVEFPKLLKFYLKIKMEK